MGDMLLSEIKDIDDEEAVKQVMNTVIYQVLDDTTSNKWKEKMIKDFISSVNGLLFHSQVKSLVVVQKIWK